MPHRCVHVDAIEIEPIRDGNLRFWIVTGEERLPFCMSNAVARRTNSIARRLLDTADLERQAAVARLHLQELARTG